MNKLLAAAAVGAFGAFAAKKGYDAYLGMCEDVIGPSRVPANEKTSFLDAALSGASKQINSKRTNEDDILVAESLLSKGIDPELRKEFTTRLLNKINSFKKPKRIFTKDEMTYGSVENNLLLSNYMHAYLIEKFGMRYYLPTVFLGSEKNSSLLREFNDQDHDFSGLIEEGCKDVKSVLTSLKDKAKDNWNNYLLTGAEVDPEIFSSPAYWRWEVFESAATRALTEELFLDFEKVQKEYFVQLIEFLNDETSNGLTDFDDLYEKFMRHYTSKDSGYKLSEMMRRLTGSALFTLDSTDGGVRSFLGLRVVFDDLTGLDTTEAKVHPLEEGVYEYVKVVIRSYLNHNVT